MLIKKEKILLPVNKPETLRPAKLQRAQRFLSVVKNAIELPDLKLHPRAVIRILGHLCTQPPINIERLLVFSVNKQIERVRQQLVHRFGNTLCQTNRLDEPDIFIAFAHNGLLLLLFDIPKQQLVDVIRIRRKLVAVFRIFFLPHL